MLIDKKNVTSIKIMWDCEFYHQLIKGFLKIKDNRVGTLLASIMLRECTVFVMEMASYFPVIEDVISSDCSNLFRDTYTLIRNRIHYFTSQPFDYTSEKSSAENTISDIQNRYLTRPVDDISVFRYDLSYIKVEDVLFLSSIDIAILFEGTAIEQKGCIIGHALKQYSADLAGIISVVKQAISNSELEQIVRLEELMPHHNANNIEFFDGKFDIAVNRLGNSKFLTIISLRMLSDIGSLLYIVKKLFDVNWSSSYHLYFWEYPKEDLLTKYLFASTLSVFKQKTLVIYG